MPNNEIVVIILTVNQKETTLNCVESLISIAEPKFRIVVWDNGSTDGTAISVKEKYPHVEVHHNPINLGVASGRNSAAELAMDIFNPDYLLFLDNDMILESNFMRELVRPFSTDNRIGQTQAKLRFLHDQVRLNDGGGAQIDFVHWQVKPVGFGELDRGQHDQIKSCIACGGAMMVRSDVFQELGGFDTKFDPFGPEDLDFSLRLQKAGYLALYIPTAGAYHTVSHTYGQGYSEEYARHKARHWFTFMRRHATVSQQLAFLFYGAPISAIRVVYREFRTGNFRGVRGLILGTLDSIKRALKFKTNGIHQ